MGREFSDITIKEVNEIVNQFPNKKSSLMMVMRVAEREFGYLDTEKCEYIAKMLGLSPIYVLGCLRFYYHFKREFHGKYRIMVCCTLMCDMKGALDIVSYLENQLSIKVGERTADGKFSLEKVECIGACHKSPAMQINEKDYYDLTPSKIDEILKSLE